MSLRICLCSLLLAASLFARPSTGEIRLAAILVKFQNDVNNTAFVPGNIPATPQACRDFLFESPQSVNAFFQENSYGRLALTGDVFGPYVIPVDAPSAVRDSACMCYEETIAAADNDIRFDQYDIILIIYPRTRNAAGGYVNYCGFQGAGTEKPITTGEGTFTKTIHWINGFVDLHIMAHEIGHYLGFLHANKLDCDECYEYHRDCHSLDAQDPFDAMGYSTAPGYAGPGHFNAYNKLSAGWLDEASVLRIDRPKVYDVTLTALESDAAGIKCVLIPFNKRLNYCLEFRRNIGFDAPLAPLDGVLVRLSSSLGANVATDLVQPVCGSQDLLLRPGQLFRDGGSYVHVEALEQNGDHIKIQVLYNAFNIGASLYESDWPESLSLGDTLILPVALYNDSPVAVAESLFLQANIKDTRGWPFQETIFAAPGLGENDSANTFFKYLPQSGSGDYNFILNVLTPKGFSELNLADNYLTDREKGETVTVLRDGPDFHVTIRTIPMVFTPGRPVEIAYDLQNIGQRDSGPFSVRLKYGDRELIHAFDNIPAGAIASRSVQQSYECGVYEIRVDVDRENRMLENDEYNNVYSWAAWSDQLCEEYSVRPVFGPGGDFGLNDNLIIVRKSSKDFYFYSPFDQSLRVVHPLYDGSLERYDFDVSNQYCVVVEEAGRDTSILNIHNLQTGETQTIPAEHPAQSYPTTNNDWIAWLESSNSFSPFGGNVLYAKNLRTGGKKLIDADVYLMTLHPELTNTNLLFWETRLASGQSPIAVLDLEQASEPILLPQQISFFHCYFEGNTIVYYDGFRQEIVWQEYDAKRQAFAEIRRQFLPDSSRMDSGVNILDFDERYFLYESSHAVFLYSNVENKARCLSDIFGGIGNIYLREDEIIALFYSYPWEYFIGSVKISDIQNIPVTVEKRVEENSAPFTAAPNPFNRQTKITYQLANAAEAEITIFNTMGQAIADYALGKQAAGAHSFVWDGSSAGIPVASGVYFCALKIDGNYSTTLWPIKVVLLK